MLAALAAAAMAADQSGLSDSGQKKVCYSKGKSGSRLKWICQDPPAEPAPHRAKARSDSGATRLVGHTEPVAADAEGDAPKSEPSRPVGQWISTDGAGTAAATDDPRSRGPATILPQPEPIERGPATIVPQPEPVVRGPQTAAAPGPSSDAPVLEYAPPAENPTPLRRIDPVAQGSGAGGQGAIPRAFPFEGPAGSKKLDLADICRSPKELKRINELTTNIKPSPRATCPRTVRWETTCFGRAASRRPPLPGRLPDLCHKPLYFEDVQLERYGHMAGPWVQPFVSCADFFLRIPILPYEMGLEPPNECIYALGYYRPGSCAPTCSTRFR